MCPFNYKTELNKIVFTSSHRNVCCSMPGERSTWNSWCSVQTVWREIDTMGINFTPAMDGIKMTGPAESWVATLSENTSDSSPEHRNAKPLRDSISDCQKFVWACLRFSKKYHDLVGAVSGFRPSFLPKVSTDSLHTTETQVGKYANREIKCRKFVSRKLIQVGKRWSNKQFEILNRTFIQQIVWNSTNPLVLTFLGFLLIYRFRTRRIGSGPKIQIHKHSWRRKSVLGEKCLKQTGSGSFVVACPQLRSLCPVGAIAYVWLFCKANTARLKCNLDGDVVDDKTASYSICKSKVCWHFEPKISVCQCHRYGAFNFEIPWTKCRVTPLWSDDDDDGDILQRHLSGGWVAQSQCRVLDIVWEHLVTTTVGQWFVMVRMMMPVFIMISPEWYFSSFVNAHLMW